MTESIGHNSTVHGIARDQLRAFVHRLERVNEEIKCLNDDKKDIYGEAKSMGFDTKVLKRLIARRAKDQQALMEEDLILETYERALEKSNDGSQD